MIKLGWDITVLPHNFLGGERMLEIVIEDQEYYDDRNNRFVDVRGGKFQFEHSLVAITKWEHKYQRPFLANPKLYPKTEAEMLDYFKMMSIGQEVDTYLFNYDVTTKIIEYINSDPSKGTTIADSKKETQQKILTSEVIYAYMFISGMDIACENWNIYRLLKVLNTMGALREGPKKMSPQEQRNLKHKLNKERREKLGSKG